MATWRMVVLEAEHANGSMSSIVPDPGKGIPVKSRPVDISTMLNRDMRGIQRTRQTRQKIKPEDHRDQIHLEAARKTGPLLEAITTTTANASTISTRVRKE